MWKKVGNQKQMCKLNFVRSDCRTKKKIFHLQLTTVDGIYFSIYFLGPGYPNRDVPLAKSELLSYKYCT